MHASPAYTPPYSITPAILLLVVEIGEWLGRREALASGDLTPRLRRDNRLRTIQATLAIENNTLNLEQVTAVLAGKRVLGLPREIQEVRNAFAAYERLENWEPSSVKDLLEAHGMLMAGLVDQPGTFRDSNVGIFRGDKVVHMAPPAERASLLMGDLLSWLRDTQEHPLISSCVFHYELEFIHPFQDGNGRLGRLWQALILSRWKPLLAFLPVETVIHDRQEDYYQVLAKADNHGDSACFIEFILSALLEALKEVGESDQVSDQVGDQVMRMLQVLVGKEAGATDLMRELGLSHRPSFRINYLDPALSAGLAERTQPDSPRSPTQRYRLTEKGRRVIDRQR